MRLKMSPMGFTLFVMLALVAITALLLLPTRPEIAKEFHMYGTLAICIVGTIWVIARDSKMLWPRSKFFTMLRKFVPFID